MEFYTFKDIGGRDVNEDHCGVSNYNNSFCFVVADGLGGHGGGDIASQCVVKEVCTLFMENGFVSNFSLDTLVIFVSE